MKRFLCASLTTRQNKINRKTQRYKMNISLTKRKHLLYHTILLLSLMSGVGVDLLLFELQAVFWRISVNSIYFYIFGVFNIYMFDACRRFAPDRCAATFWLYKKVHKMILSVIVLGVYCIR